MINVHPGDTDVMGLHTSTFHPDARFPKIADAIYELKETGSVVV